ncbi:HTTM domain-containing protein [Polyangium sp. y55x31]|uniref:HTTM domain-containing protein n=1 Tax=Polyangium sp. y55x31 TaxID=3042688 RepID=UPI0024823727|nr:HTTM domain-containing protein [Polyangium sp. y55x31]MDI1477099.1 HTTM domain-containing protein [Polyangium sp. y55x31]
MAEIAAEGEVTADVPKDEPREDKPARPRFSRLRAAFAWLRDHYMTMDPRTLGFFRLVIGFLVTADCIRHWKEARWFYSNEGVLTNHYHLFRPSSGFNFSIFHAFSSLEEVHVAFAIATLCHFCFFIGWHTRIFSILSFFFVTSLDNRLVMVENGGYVVENLVLGWAMFMPTGQRFSVDALLRSFRERKERSPEELNARAPFAWATKPYVSLIGLLTTLNIAVIYYFNVVNKSGNIWRKGDTVHYVLHLDRMITGLAVPFREYMPLWMMRPVAWSVLVVEAILVPLILAPAGRRVTRPLAMLLMTGLHGTFGVMMRLGPFSWFMIAWGFLFPQPVHWEILGRWYTKKARAWVVVYDRRSPLAFFLCRLFARLDHCERLTFEPSPEDEATPKLLRVRDPATNEAHDDHAALAAIARSLPAGRFLWPLFRVVSLGLSGPLFGYVAHRRDAVARAFGLSATPRGREASAQPSPLAARLGRVRVGLREALVAWFFVCAVSQVLNENKSVPAPFKHQQPWLMQATLGYPRMFQGWGMFAPNPISDDGSISIDAVTIGGRRVDPFTGEAPDLNLSDARGLGLNQIWQDYFNRIRLDRNKVFRHGLKEYLLRWHEETGRPEDELVAFDVYWLRDQCPLPGQTQPYKHEKIAILTYRKPGYRPAPGNPPLPPEPKVESAGN